MKKHISKLTPRFIFPIVRKLYYSFLKIRFRGHNVYCPVCEVGYKKFLPGGENNRANVKCPGCGTLERHRLLWLFLTQKIKIAEREILLLDIAPDQTLQKKFNVFKNINYVSIDIDSVFAMRKMDLTNLSFDDNSFDAVLCYHVLEHIEDDKKALKEIYRVMKNGAWAILQSPVDLNKEYTYEDSNIKSEEDRLKIFGQKDHVRIYGKDYVDRLRNPGFKVEEINYVKSFAPEEIKKYGLDENEIIYFCKRLYKK